MTMPTSWKALLLGAIGGAWLSMAAIGAEPTATLPGNHLADTPPLGWNCYHAFGTTPDEAMIRKAADAIVASGLKDAGYLYVNMDDGWMTAQRDSSGDLVADPVRFPSGLKALTDYIHSKGLKAGIYLTCGQQTYQNLAGSLGFETRDAEKLAAWGFDFLKYDYKTMPNDPPRDAKAENITMSLALRKTGRPILFSMCEHGRSEPWTWAAEYAQMWRISTDIKDLPEGEFEGGWGYNKIVDDKDAALSRYAGPGHWNDPDMLIVGLHGKHTWMGPGCTDVEYRAHFSLWTLLAAPLILGVDPSNMTNFVKETVMNPEIIAVNQDKLGIQATRVFKADSTLDVWLKPLQDGSWAVGLHNRSAADADMAVSWGELKLAPGTAATVRNLWTRSDVGSYKDSFSAKVASHECVVLKITPR